MAETATQTDTILNVRLDAFTLGMVETIRTDLNLKSVSEALRVLIKKGYDQHNKEQAYLAGTI